jgi:hypothetical protein
MTLGNENIGASFWRGNINAKGLKQWLSWEGFTGTFITRWRRYVKSKGFSWFQMIPLDRKDFDIIAHA